MEYPAINVTSSGKPWLIMEKQKEQAPFVTHDHLQKTLVSLSAQFKNNLYIYIWKRLIQANTVCSSIGRVFPDDVTYSETIQNVTK